jgi:hypothetical protein
MERSLQGAGWLGVLGASLGGLRFGAGQAQAAMRAPRLLDRADSLLQAVPARRSAVAVGRAHLAEAAVRPDLADLVDEVSAKLNGPGQDRPGADELKARLRARTSDDFANGRTIRVDGWVLGETEVRLSTIAALAA